MKENKNLPEELDALTTFLPSAALWSEPLGPHALKNAGPTHLHIISVEIKNRT